MLLLKQECHSLKTIFQTFSCCINFFWSASLLVGTQNIDQSMGWSATEWQARNGESPFKTISDYAVMPFTRVNSAGKNLLVASKGWLEDQHYTALGKRVFPVPYSSKWKTRTQVKRERNIICKYKVNLNNSPKHTKGVGDTSLLLNWNKDSLRRFILCRVSFPRAPSPSSGILCG